MTASIPAATLLGVDGHAVDVEVHVSNGLPCFTVVGLPDASCREARDRVRAALLSSGRAWPQRRITVNLAPSSIRKGGAALDLPIAVGVLVADGVVPAEAVRDFAFLGELGLDGSVRPVPGTLSLVDAVTAPTIVVAAASAVEARLPRRHRVRPVEHLTELVDALLGTSPWPDDPPPSPVSLPAPMPDLADVRGQPHGRWAMEVAAAGGHHVLLVGPPGAGKTMLARRLPGLLPPLDRVEALEVTRVHSAAGLALPPSGLVEWPPLRAPHHGASAVSLIGGGSGWLRPGEISTAHRGVLLLDEIAEFPAAVLDALRQPLEEGVVRVARAKATVAFPARFQLVGTMNPCPCGDGGPPGSCRCSEQARQRYGRRLSGPLLDRFDLRVPVMRPLVEDLLAPHASPDLEPSRVVAGRVVEARARATGRGVRANAELPSELLDLLAPMDAPATAVLEFKLRTGALSARGLHRIHRVARTIADLGGADVIGEEHVCGALELRTDIDLLEQA